MWKSIAGIKTVKALALESSRSADWDRRVAEVAELNVELGAMANWPATLTLPLQRYCTYGAVTLGAYIALHSQPGLRCRQRGRLPDAGRACRRAAGQPRQA